MSNSTNKSTTLLFALAVTASAFLLFQVQPIISKAILPWFGGSPTVWTTCMLFFQVVLFAGYTYAHLLSKYLKVRTQAVVHLGLILLGCFILPIIPTETWKPTGSENPVLSIALLLTVTLGLPYLLLAANGPLLQVWFAKLNPGRSPYRLYALSNIGSLVALLSYPFLVEPSFSMQFQAIGWSLGYVGYAAICMVVCWAIWKYVPAVELKSDTESSNERDAEPTSPITWKNRLYWLLLPAFACVLLLATTNHVCQDMAVVPFLWVLPLSLYLLTFILCFDGTGWYKSEWISWLTIAFITIISTAAIFGINLGMVLTVTLYFSTMFFICMICHGELVRMKPDARHLTAYYLMISAGGALGGIVVSILCPMIFTSYLEMPLALLLGFFLAAVVLSRIAKSSSPTENKEASIIPKIVWISFPAFLIVLYAQLGSFGSNYIESRRNFYGTLHIGEQQRGTPDAIRTMYHGRIVHGFQYLDPTKVSTPTSYYSQETGIGLAMQRFSTDSPKRVGVVGLGAGTLAAYGQPGDYFRMYEINPDVIELAQQHFTFMKDSPAEIEVILGDARLSLEREPNQKFDLLVLDAFSGDAIPTHLLTQEAFAIYRKHLKPDGILAVHISNMHVDLRPVVSSLCQNIEINPLYITSQADAAQHLTGSQWILGTANRSFIQDPIVQSRTQQNSGQLALHRLWTDNYSNLLEVLK
ncbi:MAG: hypothetical protein COA78_01140 [Blastopirellula sp.]|nr:MAG: hypothetical protein COA78_01140 [Blastopirellula sp.]